MGCVSLPSTSGRARRRRARAALRARSGRDDGDADRRVRVGPAPEPNWMLRAEPEPVVGPRFSRAPWAGWAAGARRTPPRGIFPFFVGAEPEAAAREWETSGAGALAAVLARARLHYPRTSYRPCLVLKNFTNFFRFYVTSNL